MLKKDFLMRKKIKLGLFLAASLSLASALFAEDTQPKQALLSNYTLSYANDPKSVSNFADMFSDGEVYGRLRLNSFLYEWEKETASQDSHTITGLGGSLVYKSAALNNLSFGMGLYYSMAFFDENSNPEDRLKSGKDLVSRYNFFTNNDKTMAVLGQAYIDCTALPKTDIRLGRQLVEAFYVKSNDTKMIPNTFDGVVIDNKAISQTSVKIAYLTKEKLRDHTSSHSILMYDNSDTTAKSTWDGNDDVAMHQGLSYTNLKANDIATDAPLITGDINNKSIENLTIDASFYSVPKLLSQIMGELNYKIKYNGFSVAPGIRYIKQFDDEAGKVGGAALDGTPTGYKNTDSLDSQMIAARIVTSYDIYKLNLGYSKTFDEADLVTPWRAFPTAEYTRSMARTNWIANTQSYRAELNINPNKSNIYKSVVTQLSVFHSDADESKGQYDENYYYAGFTQNVPAMLELQYRVRFGYADTEKKDADNLDARLELNYLF